LVLIFSQQLSRGYASADRDLLMSHLDKKETESHIYWIDGARGLCAFAVILGHLRQILFTEFGHEPTGLLSLIYRLAWRASAYSHKAVIIFFVLSGYLVGGYYIKKIINRIDSPIDYISARVARIYTVLIPGLIFTFVAMSCSINLFEGQRLLQSTPAFFPQYMLSENTFTPWVATCNLIALQTIYCHQYGLNLSLWSLSNECLYYIFFFCFANSFKHRFYALPTIAVVAVMLLPAAAYADIDRSIIYFMGLGIWLTGTLALVVSELPLHKPFSILISLAGLCIAVLSEIYAFNFHLADFAFGVQAACILIIINILKPSPYLMKHWLIQVIAGMSYSLYEIHLPIMILLLSIFGLYGLEKNWTSLIESIAIIIFVLFWTYGFHQLTEKHTGLVRQKLRNWLEAALLRVRTRRFASAGK
jgi:peptidoglycan/LPS O-acetylase OafA/YrhL